MIQNILFLAGGLGNQLFQVAFAIDRYGLGNFKIDWSKRHPRNKDLDIPSIIEVIPFLEGHLLHKRHNSRSLSFMYRLSFSTFQKPHREKSLLKRLLKNPSHVLLKIYFGLRYRHRVSFTHDTNAQRSIESKSEVCIGYFQSSRFIDNLGIENFPVVFPSISDKGSELLSSIEEKKPVIVHVRLGDYINNPSIGILDESFYKKAFEISRQKVANPIWVFTDSEELVLDFIPNSLQKGIKIVESQDLSPGELLTCMTRGALYIISNSTLAWWAAFLRVNPEAPVLAPEKWFNSIVFSEDLLPEDWIKIPNDFR